MKPPGEKTGLFFTIVFLTAVSGIETQAIETPVCPEMIVSETSAKYVGRSNLSANLSSGLEYRYYSFYSDSADTIKRYIQNERSYRRKSPAMAFVYGFFPGFIVHGSGHYYIGETKTANVLLGTEVICIAVTYVSVMVGIGHAVGENAETSSTTAGAFGSIAVLTFLATWVYDFSAAPAKAIELNKKHGYSLQLQPRINGDMASINMTLTFK
jgi:hypothetical protein